jgi:hypothetical protein
MPGILDFHRIGARGSRGAGNDERGSGLMRELLNARLSLVFNAPGFSSEHHGASLEL